jgi:hypothetical protein
MLFVWSWLGVCVAPSEFDFALLSLHPCPFLERACPGFNRFAGDFESAACQEPFAGAFPVVASSHLDLGINFSMKKGRFRCDFRNRSFRRSSRRFGLGMQNTDCRVWDEKNSGSIQKDIPGFRQVLTHLGPADPGLVVRQTQCPVVARQAQGLQFAAQVLEVERFHFDQDSQDAHGLC